MAKSDYKFVITCVLFFTVANSGRIVSGLNCFICTNLPDNGTDFYRDGCNNSGTDVPQTLLAECPEEPYWFPKPPQPNVSTSSMLHGLMKQLTSQATLPHHLPRDAANPSVFIDQMCMKFTADFGGTKYYVRSCIVALSKDKSHCERLSSDYNLGPGVDAKNVRLCFCSKDGCNSASRHFSFGQSLFLVLITIIKGWI